MLFRCGLVVIAETVGLLFIDSFGFEGSKLNVRYCEIESVGCVFGIFYTQKKDLYFTFYLIWYFIQINSWKRYRNPFKRFWNTSQTFNSIHTKCDYVKTTQTENPTILKIDPTDRKHVHHFSELESIEKPQKPTILSIPCRRFSENLILLRTTCISMVKVAHAHHSSSTSSSICLPFPRSVMCHFVLLYHGKENFLEIFTYRIRDGTRVQTFSWILHF